MERLQEKGIPYLFLTNNATKTPEEVALYLKNTCNIDAKASQVYTSGLAAIDFVKREYPGARTYIVGEAALVKQAQAAGLELTDVEAEVVIQALDRAVTYEKLMIASNAIRQNAAFIVTNPDTNLPTATGFVPGAGALTAFLKTSTQRNPVIIGKPFSHIMEGALRLLDLPKEDVVMVGDNYNTDILAGINFGMDTLLTLTGFTQLTDLEEKNVQPTYIVNDLAEWDVL